MNLSVPEDDIRSVGTGPSILLAKLRCLSVTGETLYISIKDQHQISDDLGIDLNCFSEHLAILHGLNMLFFTWEREAIKVVIYADPVSRIEPSRSEYITKDGKAATSEKVHWEPQMDTLATLRKQGVRPHVFTTLIRKYIDTTHECDDRKFIQFCLVSDEVNNIKKIIKRWKPPNWLTVLAKNKGFNDSHVNALLHEFKTKRIMQPRLSNNLDLEFERFILSRARSAEQ